MDAVEMYLVGDSVGLTEKQIHADVLVPSITAAWRDMEQLQRDGLARSIGVANFSTAALQAIVDQCEVGSTLSQVSRQIVPAVNQIEFHPYSLPTYGTLLPFCRKHGIVIGAYSTLYPLTRLSNGPVDIVVARTAFERDLGETPAQILLMWAQQSSGGYVVT